VRTFVRLLYCNEVNREAAFFTCANEQKQTPTLWLRCGGIYVHVCTITLDSATRDLLSEEVTTRHSARESCQLKAIYS
jgi:hypothetical protein